MLRPSFIQPAVLMSLPVLLTLLILSLLLVLVLLLISGILLFCMLVLWHLTHLHCSLARCCNAVLCRKIFAAFAMLILLR
jgi:hypothetical protein